MRMVIQNALTDAYLGQNEDWTDKASEARVFDAWLEACDYTLDRQLTDTFIVPLALDAATLGAWPAAHRLD